MNPRWLSVAVRTGGLIAVVALQVGWMRLPVPLSLKLLQVALIGLAAWRPGDALLVLAGVGPLATSIWTLLGSSSLGTLILEKEDIYLKGAAGASLLVSWSGGTPFLEQLVLAVITGVLLRARSGACQSLVSRRATALAAIAVASAAVLLPGRILAAAPEAFGWPAVAAIWSGAYFTAPQSGQPLAPFFYAGLIVEGLALAWVAERATREDPSLVRRVVAVSVGACAAAALVNLNAIVSAALNTADRSRSVVTMLVMKRASLQFDKNAAGSVLVLVLISSILLLRRPPRRVVLVSALMVLLAVGLWLTGSRAALLSLVVTLIGALAVMIGATSRQARRRLALAATAIVGVAVLAWAYYPRERNIDLSGTVTTRWIVARAAVRMAMSAPIFGVGIGTFIERSGDFGTGPSNPLGGTTSAHENAHNNFLQVLAEEGVVGLAALIALITVVVVPASPGAATSGDRRWLLAGVSGCILTWLAGHPLLVPEAAFTFWLFFGMLAGLTPVPAPRPGHRLLMWLPVVLFVSLPFRVAIDLQSADLSHVGLRLSPRERDADGTSYRVAGQSFSLYIAANQVVVVPVRREPGAPAQMRLEYRVDGVLVNAVTLSGEAWRPLTLRLQSKARRFLRVDFVVVTEGSDPLPRACIRVGPDQVQ